jgi:hypothetical protein
MATDPKVLVQIALEHDLESACRSFKDNPNADNWLALEHSMGAYQMMRHGFETTQQRTEYCTELYHTVPIAQWTERLHALNIARATVAGVNPLGRRSR